MITTLLQIYWVFLPLAVILGLIVVYWINRTRLLQNHPKTLNLGSVTEGEINPNDATLFHTLDAQAGETLYLRVMSLTPYLVVKYTLTDPQGQVWFTGTHLQNQPSGLSIMQPSTAGIFTLAIESAQGTGKYAVSVEKSD